MGHGGWPRPPPYPVPKVPLHILSPRFPSVSCPPGLAETPGAGVFCISTHSPPSSLSERWQEDQKGFRAGSHAGLPWSVSMRPKETPPSPLPPSPASASPLSGPCPGGLLNPGPCQGALAVVLPELSGALPPPPNTTTSRIQSRNHYLHSEDGKLILVPTECSLVLGLMPDHLITNRKQVPLSSPL